MKTEKEIPQHNVEQLLAVAQRQRLGEYTFGDYNSHALTVLKTHARPEEVEGTWDDHWKREHQKRFLKDPKPYAYIGPDPDLWKEPYYRHGVKWEYNFNTRVLTLYSRDPDPRWGSGAIAHWTLTLDLVRHRAIYNELVCPKILQALEDRAERLYEKRLEEEKQRIIRAIVLELMEAPVAEETD